MDISKHVDLQKLDQAGVARFGPFWNTNIREPLLEILGESLQGPELPDQEIDANKAMLFVARMLKTFPTLTVRALWKALDELYPVEDEAQEVLGKEEKKSDVRSNADKIAHKKWVDELYDLFFTRDGLPSTLGFVLKYLKEIGDGWVSSESFGRHVCGVLSISAIRSLSRRNSWDRKEGKPVKSFMTESSAASVFSKALPLLRKNGVVEEETMNEGKDRVAMLILDEFTFNTIMKRAEQRRELAELSMPWRWSEHRETVLKPPKNIYFGLPTGTPVDVPDLYLQLPGSGEEIAGTDVVYNFMLRLSLTEKMLVSNVLKVMQEGGFTSYDKMVKFVRDCRDLSPESKKDLLKEATKYTNWPKKAKEGS
jgi:hypothetical protein